MKQKKYQHKIASCNCQSIVISNAKCTMLANDFKTYRVDVVAVQETHLSRFGTKLLTLNLNKQYLPYYYGSENKSQNRVGVILSPELKATFKLLNDRVCQVTLKSDSAYAPTLEKSKQNPKIRGDFYSKLNDLIKTHKSKHITIVIAGFSPKTGSTKSDMIYHRTTGPYR